MRGLFISLEGIDGCGKDTQCKLLKDYLKQKGYLVMDTREPGGSRISEEIRRIILDPIHKNMDSITELLLLEASRAQFTVQKVMPLLREGGIIVSGRYFDSTTAYQGYGNGTHLWDVNYLNKLSTQGLEPDMTFLLDIECPVKSFFPKILHRFAPRDFWRTSLLSDEQTQLFWIAGIEFCALPGNLPPIHKTRQLAIH